MALGLSLGARAQSGAALFRTDAEARAAAAGTPLAGALTHARPLTLDVVGLRAALAAAPLETAAGRAPLVLSLPAPDGTTQRFALRETFVMAPALAARFPQIKTYAGQGLDDASASLRLDLSLQGFHAQVLASNGRTYYIDPVSRTDTRHYVGFYKRDMNRAAAGAPMTCGFAPSPADLKASRARVAAATAPGAAARLLASGSQLKTYRLALANTPQYAVTKGNTVAGVVAAEVTTLNRVVGVYEKELAVRLVLVANNSQLVFLSGTGPQPSPAYSNNNGSAMLSQNQTNVDARIGSANYDIGHVFSTGGGGVAFLGSVCNNSIKAGGVTGSPSPVGDAFDIDYVAHEIGHQFSGNHPFNGDAGSCAGGNRNATTAWEPGSGSTIMAYAGICTPSNDLQLNSDAIFHTGNYQEMRAFIAGTSCGTTTPTGNTAPVVTAPASGETLPIGTPFKLTASATDAESDPLTYLWEQLDLGPQASPTAAQVAGQTVPLFRSFVPETSPTRFFPRLPSLVNNTTVLGERLPTVTRTLRFRCTARDQHSGPAGVIGGVDYSALVNLNVTSTAGPFVVTAPNTAVSWTGGAPQNVTWNVAGTNIAPVSCALVNIRLSLDGGLTYPTVLATNEANDGTATVIAPVFGATQTQARIMIEAADNYFFDISNVNFTITPPAAGPTISSFSPGGGLAGTVVTILGSNLTGATAVAFNGTAAASFTVNSATQITATVAAGTTTGPISVTGPGGTGTSAASFVVGVPPVISSFNPTSGVVGTTVVITGTAFSGATAVAFNGTAAAGFTVNSATQITATVAAGSTTGPISVTTSVATGTSAGSFTVVQAPVVTSFTPGSGPAGTVVVVTGSFFSGATQVTFNGTPATTFAVNTDTQITVTVPAGASTGPIGVTGAGGTGTSGADFLVSPINDLCANALPLACGQTITASTIGSSATGDPTASCGTSITTGGIFYTITGTGAAITVTTCNPATNFDTKLFVFSGACGVYTCVGGNDDDAGCDVASTVTFASVAGTVYRVFVSGFGSETGTFALTATCAGLPSLVISTGTQASPVAVTAGAYNSLTVTGTGVAQLTGSASFTSSVTVQPDGILFTNCQPLTGTATFTLAAGATLGICDPAGITASGATGAVQTSGARSFSPDAVYLYNGTAAQATGNGLPSQVRSLGTNNNAPVTLSAPVAVVQAVGVGGAGNLVLNGQALTLLSNATSTALVINNGTGTVSGTTTVQRYLDPSLNAGLGYRHLSAPVSNTTVADLATGAFTPEVSQAGTYNTSPTPGTTTPFPTVFGYDQSRVNLANDFAPFDRGFFVPAAAGTPLAVGRGYAVNLAAGQVVDFVGQVNNGDQALPLTRTTGPDAGWHLLGNPYPSPLDVSLVAAADRPNLDAAMYIFESASQYAGNYRTYVNGIGGNPLVGLGQGLFVRVSAGQTNGSFTFRNSQRVTSFGTQVPVRRSAPDTRPLVRLELRGATGAPDAFYAYAETGATPTFDARYDAVKRPNTTGLNLASVTSGSDALAIDGRPAFAPGTVLPLAVGVPAAGTYTLTAAALTNLPATLDAFLNDALTGQTLNLRLQPAHSFTLTPAQAATPVTGRFSLTFAPRTALATVPGLTSAAVTLFPVPAHQQFTVSAPAIAATTAVRVELLNTLGQVVRRQVATGGQFVVDAAGLAAGVYTLRLQVGTTSLAKRVELQ